MIILKCYSLVKADFFATIVFNAFSRFRHDLTLARVLIASGASKGPFALLNVSRW